MSLHHEPLRPPFLQRAQTTPCQHDTAARHTMDAIAKVYHDHPKTLLFSTAAVLRLLLALTFPALPDLLTGRVEISSPVNSFKRRMLDTSHTGRIG